MIIRRRLQQREEAKMAHPENDDRQDTQRDQDESPEQPGKQAAS